MGALAQIGPWIPEDDLLLKNAVEAGASLESLAKGAVHFSRRFSIRELQDRWHALLYDPVVSAEAAFRMTELERSNPNFPTKFARTGYSKENKSSSRKRKSEKLRSSYYSLRKKFRSEPFNSLDLGFLVPPNDSHFMENGDATHLGLEESHMDIIHNAFPEILANGGCVNHVVSEDNLQGDISHVGGEIVTLTENPGPSGCDGVHQDSKLKLETAAQEPKPTVASTDCFLEELSNSLFNDVDPFLEVDGKDVDKSYYDGLSSLLVNSTNETNQSALPNSTEEDSVVQKYPGDATLDDHVIPELDGKNAIKLMQPRPVSDSSAMEPHPEVVDGVISCILNREDPEIPCNDDIFLSNNCHPMSVSSLARRNFKDINNPIGTCVRELSSSRERSEGYLLHTQKKIPGRLQGASQGKAEIGQPGQCIKFRGLASAESHNTMVPSASTCAGEAQACSNTQLCAGTGTKDGNKVASEKLFLGCDDHGSYPRKDNGNCKEEQGILAAVNEAPHATGGDDGLIEISDPEQEITRTADGHVFESEEDLPNYSDIEAMILDMDLDPDDHDIFDLEVSKYQSQDMKRSIIRLEQAAHSYMQRAIASRRAYAVLYGRYSKHFIKKLEVLVGRSTEDLIVDIDLGRERRGSKISRRQAIIRLGDDGFFHIKNLGKYPISVNEKEVDPGQSIILKSDCLVEIRGMPFIFETNESRIKEYLDNMGKEN